MFQIVVQTDDIRDVSADIVVLKHAQSFYGADAVVAASLTGNLVHELEISPKVGDFALVSSAGVIASPHVLFVGVLPLIRFEYPQIRAFASRAIMIVAEEVPSAEHIAITVHGVGYGLDEREAFLALVGGLWDAASRAPAISSSPSPRLIP